MAILSLLTALIFFGAIVYILVELAPLIIKLIWYGTLGILGLSCIALLFF